MTINDSLILTLRSEGFVLNQDFVVEGDRLMLISDRAIARVRELRPPSCLSPVLVKETESGWKCIASLGQEPHPFNTELADPVVNRLIQAVITGDRLDPE